MLFAMHTLWVREHNRVCDQLAAQHPEWTDEWLYAAARRILVGQMMGIMINDVLNVGGNRWPSKHDSAARWAAGDRPSTTPLEMLLTMMMPSGGAGAHTGFENAKAGSTSFHRDSRSVVRNCSLSVAVERSRRPTTHVRCSTVERRDRETMRS
uniref:Prostaglandin G/H synthase 2 n=1 Tax=Sipha flava TaxID=143950 RepID=A0A2S2QQI6_9HEMI